MPSVSDSRLSARRGRGARVGDVAAPTVPFAAVEDTLTAAALVGAEQPAPLPVRQAVGVERSRRPDLLEMRPGPGHPSARASALRGRGGIRVSGYARRWAQIFQSITDNDARVGGPDPGVCQPHHQRRVQ